MIVAIRRLKNPSDLQILIYQVVEISEGKGLSLNIKKTEFMIISKTQLRLRLRHDNLQIHREVMERVKRYRYLGIIVNENSDYTEEIRSRIRKEKEIMNTFKIRKL